MRKCRVIEMLVINGMENLVWLIVNVCRGIVEFCKSLLLYNNNIF